MNNNINICAISDSHLGYRHRLKFQRLKDYENAFKEAVEKAMQFEPKILIFLGDLFHYSKPDAKSMHLVMKTLMKIANNSTHIILCIGNHEIEGNLFSSYLPLFSELHENIHVLSTENSHMPIKIGGDKKISLHGFEFLRNRKDAEETLKKISSEVKEVKDKEKGSEINILCLHQALQNYLDPFEISINSLKEVANKYDLILFGHVHKYQKIQEVSPIPCFYVGSTERISFNESENKNGFLLFKNLNFFSSEFIEINSAKMKQIKEDIGEKTPNEINSYIENIIKKNSDTKLLQLSIEAEIKGSDYLDIKHDWEKTFPEFTILDILVMPKNLSEKKVAIEKIELSEKLIDEYFEKIGVKEEGLKELCVKLYEKYGK